MSSSVVLRALSRQFKCALVDDEIDAALIFIGVARQAYAAGRFLEGNDALSKAEAIHAQASELAQGSAEEQPALAKQLSDVRSTIKKLRAGGARAVTE